MLYIYIMIKTDLIILLPILFTIYKKSLGILPRDELFRGTTLFY